MAAGVDLGLLAYRWAVGKHRRASDIKPVFDVFSIDNNVCFALRVTATANAPSSCGFIRRYRLEIIHGVISESCLTNGVAL